MLRRRMNPKVDPQSPDNKQEWVGRAVPRREDARLLRGEAKFMDDMPTAAGTLEVAILRSPHAHARIKTIKTEAAAALPGVRAIATGTDIAALTNPVPNVLKAPVPYYPIAVDRTRYVGEPVAIIVADDRYIAEDALDNIDVEYETLTPVVDPTLAESPQSTVLHDSLGRNVVHQKEFVFGDPDRAFANCDHVVSVDVRYPRIMSTPIETYGVVAEYDVAGDRYSVWSNFQGPFIGHPIIAAALKTPSARVRLMSAPMNGGSFGVKWGVFSYIILIAVAAKIAKAPVKWIEDRAEHLAASSCSTDRISRLEGAFSRAGRLQGLRVRQLENVGAYLRPPEPSTLYRTHGNLNGPYDVSNIAVSNTVVLTNQMPTGLNRGFGGPQYYFPLERLMHEAAKELDIDPLELRLRNLVRPEQMPYECASGVRFDGGDYPATVRYAAELARYDELIHNRGKARAKGELYGVGIAISIESSASSLAYVNAALPREESGLDKSGGIASATITADPTGQIVLRLPTIPAGQGHETALAQIVADELGITPDDVEVITTIDTNLSDWSITSGNYANRFSGADTTAAVLAARKMAAKFKRLAAAKLDSTPDQIELREGRARVAGHNIDVSLKRLAAWTHWDSSQLPMGEEGGFTEVGVFTPTSLLPPDRNGRVASSLSSTLMCDIAAVRVCRDTGRITLDRYIATHDVGRVINPALLEGQVRGGFAHGFGAATMERINYDAQGQLLTGTFADYLCPTARDIPRVELGHVTYPTDRNETGARGLGDGSSMNVPAAIANALADAIGRADLALPLTPSRVWSYVNGLDPDKITPANQAAATPPGDPTRQQSAPGDLVGQGEALLPKPPAEVWSTLFDLDGLARIIPGCREIRETEPDHFEAKLVISVAGMRSSYDAKIVLSEKIESTALRISGEAKGALGHSSGDAYIRLEDRNGKTLLRYDYRARVGGRVASVGHRMLNGVINILAKQFFSSLSGHLNDSAKGANALVTVIRHSFARLRDLLR
jgi:2-furoyl-CoA dehydrogenase large subunit